MKKTTRITALILSLLMLVPSVVGCASQNNTDSTDTTAASTNSSTDSAVSESNQSSEDEIYSANIPEGTDYGGYEFKIVTNNPDGTIWGDVDFNATELTGGAINDAVYQRNLNVEEKLNVKIVPVPSDDTKGTIQQSILADEDEFGLGYVNTHSAFDLAQSGLLTELHEMTDLDLDAPWWDQNSINDLSIANKVYMMTGDIGTMYKKSIGVIMFNKTILNDYNLGNPYELMNNHQWTLDNMITMAQSVSKDLNGDGKYDSEDQFGLIFFCDMMGLAFIGCGVNFITKNEQDIPELTFYSDKTVSILEKLSAILYEPTLSWSWSKNGTGEEKAFEMYKSNQSLFYYGELHAVATMREMASDFGILPMPLYDENQESYYHCINPHAAPMVTIPVTVQDRTREAHILDVLGAESKNLLTPAYYEKTLKGKVSRDEESAATLDIVISTINYDLGYLSNWGLTSIPLSLADSYDMNLASKYEKQERAIKKMMDKTIDAYTGE